MDSCDSYRQDEAAGMVGPGDLASAPDQTLRHSSYLPVPQFPYL